jgi:hypothetical protein
VHVMDRERVGIDVEVQPRRLLIADATSDQDAIGCEPKGADPILAIVEYFKRRPIVADGVGSKDVVVGEEIRGAHCR